MCITPPADPDFGTIAGECDATAQAFASALGLQKHRGAKDPSTHDGHYEKSTAGGVPNNYYIPAPSSDPRFCNAAGLCNFNVPAIYHENQYVGNADYVINSKHTLSTKYFYTANPQDLPLGQSGGDLPGTPGTDPLGQSDGRRKLTSNLTSTFINEVRMSYQRNNSEGPK